MKRRNPNLFNLNKNSGTVHLKLTCISTKIFKISLLAQDVSTQLQHLVVKTQKWVPHSKLCLKLAFFFVNPF